MDLQKVMSKSSQNLNMSCLLNHCVTDNTDRPSMERVMGMLTSYILTCVDTFKAKGINKGQWHQDLEYYNKNKLVDKDQQ